jgi:hypothetical protein
VASYDTRGDVEDVSKLRKKKNSKHSESIASNTKSPTGGIFNQNILNKKSLATLI